jgi:glutathione synthase/RimK-type ligase-like ATP-grasp enzyme
MKKIGFLTSQDIPSLGADDLLLAAEFERRSYRVVPVLWKQSPWPVTDAVIVRSPWDYYLDSEAFFDCLRRHAGDVPIFNPLALMIPNGHKSYLAEWWRQGRSVVPTIVQRDPSFYELTRIVDEFGWQDLVLKPAISAGGYKTHRVSYAEIIGQRPRVVGILNEFRAMDVLIQPFREELLRWGEMSLMFFGGIFSHAVLKVAGRHEFRVQAKYGGRLLALDLRSDVIRQAQDFLPADSLYARIDGIEDDEGRFVLMELEVIEPELFFRVAPASTRLFVDQFETLQG